MDLVITTVQKIPEPDRRYRVYVMLHRSDRPKYWNFNCPHCQTPLVELVNRDVYAIKDFSDNQNLNNTSIGVRCSGKFCKYYYYFSVS